MAARQRKPKAAPPLVAPAPTVAASIVRRSGIFLCHGRLFEMMAAMMMIGVAIIVAANPKAIEFGGFYLVAQIGLTAPVLFVVFLIAGTGRVCALIMNGGPLGWPNYGPKIRAIGAFIGMIVWAQMCYALVVWSNKSGYLSIGVSVYLFLIIGEGISCYRAATDVRLKS